MPHQSRKQTCYYAALGALRDHLGSSLFWSAGCVEASADDVERWLRSAADGGNVRVAEFLSRGGRQKCGRLAAALSRGDSDVISALR